MTQDKTPLHIKLDECNHVEKPILDQLDGLGHNRLAERHRGCKLMIQDKTPPESAEFLLYQTEDGQTRLEVAFRGETCWLSLNQLAELFQRDKSVISRHIKNIFDQSELARESVVANFATTAIDGKTYQVDYFNLDVIISVGYRVKSHRGTQFRIWATRRLREYIIKGFAMDDDRLKRDGGGNYFDELLARIRDIRSSEKVFWRKVLDIYATSIDYDSQAETSQLFFATVQNKMHWAAHGQTAAEIVYQRADSTRENMALTKEKEITMTRNKTPPHIKLDERNHVENPLHSHLNRPRLGHNRPHAEPANRQEVRYSPVNRIARGWRMTSKLPINLKDLLHQRKVEGERIEYKAGWNPDPIMRTLCAFANDFENLGGGYVVIGQDCDEMGMPIFPPKGLPDNQLDRIQQELLGFCNQIQANYLKQTVLKHPDRAEAERFWNYPYAAIEEAVVNAVYHRSYDIREPIEVRITPEDLVVLSFPGPDRSIRMDDLKQGKAISRRYRNRRIGEFLKELDLTEGRSTGISKILKVMKGNSSPPPEFETDYDRSYFLIRLPVHPETDLGDSVEAEGSEKTPVETPVETPVKTPDQILRMLDEKPEMTLAEVASKIGKSLRAVERASSKLVKAGRLRFVGSKKGGHWEVKEKL